MYFYRKCENVYIIKTEMFTCFTITALKKTWIALLSVTFKSNTWNCFSHAHCHYYVRGWAPNGWHAFAGNWH